MATVQQLLTRLENGDVLPPTIRELIAQLGFTEYLVRGNRLGWVDPLTGRVVKVGLLDVNLDHVLVFLPPGWVYQTEANAQGKWRARVAPDAGALAAAPFTKFVATEPLALAVAIYTARVA